MWMNDKVLDCSTHTVVPLTEWYRTRHDVTNSCNIKLANKELQLISDVQYLLPHIQLFKKYGQGIYFYFKKLTNMEWNNVSAGSIEMVEAVFKELLLVVCAIFAQN